LPLSRTTWFRWERLGIIPPLLRLGGKTLVPAETIEDLIAGRIVPPPSSGRIKTLTPHERKGRPPGAKSKTPKPNYRPAPPVAAAE
jgi:hypothetical protein